MPSRVLGELSPTQEHFFKKYLLEARLAHELHLLSRPDCLELMGPPFRGEKTLEADLPMLQFFFHQFVKTFPFITNNLDADQRAFWQDTVQPFVESFNLKGISESVERLDHATKRHQVNKKLLSGLLLFFNSMLITPQDILYLQADHLKPSDTGKIDKLQKGPAGTGDLSFHMAHTDRSQAPSSLKYVNDLNLNIVAVRRVGEASLGASIYSANQGSSWNPFLIVLSFSGSNSGPRHHFEFLIQVTERTLVDEKYVYETHIIARPYGQFRDLEHALKRKFPGLMATDVHRLPLKMKHDDGVEEKGSENETTTTTSSSSPEVLVTSLGSLSQSPPPPRIKLAREKLRLALRGYLNSLISHPEIAHCEDLRDFLSNPMLVFETLSATDDQDHAERVENEKLLISTQYEFQKHTSKVVVELSKDFEEFKADLIMNPNSLSRVFKEFSEKESFDDMSPILKTFMDWFKLEVAATLYQVFLSQDNSSEWFLKCKKFHRLFPYGMVYTILKYTNPVKIVGRVLDLLLVNFPSFSFPLWGSSREADELKNVSKKTGTKNLLSIIFVTLLDEDLSDYQKEITKLRESEELRPQEYAIFVKRIESYVMETNGTVLEEIKQEAVEKNADLLLTILATKRLLPLLSHHDEKALRAILASHEAYVSIEGNKEIANSGLYLNLKQYWQLQVRRKDKDIMKQLWQEPELTQLIKQFLTIFYQPLMRVFKKCDIHLVFRDYEHFMDDLMAQLTELNNGEMYYMTSIQIFSRFQKLLDKHQEVLWRFLHNLYLKDDQHIFINLIKWVEKFLTLLKMKFTDEEAVLMRLDTLEPSSAVDPELFVTQLDSRIAKIVLKRRLLKEYLQKNTTNAGDQAHIDQQWEKVNDGVFAGTEGREFGVDGADLEEFNLTHEHDASIDRASKDNAAQRELRKQIRELDQSLDSEGTSELDKFHEGVRGQLQVLLGRFRAGSVEAEVAK